MTALSKGYMDTTRLHENMAIRTSGIEIRKNVDISFQLQLKEDGSIRTKIELDVDTGYVAMLH